MNDFEMVLVVIITGITFVFTFCIRCISFSSSLSFKIFLASFLTTFLSICSVYQQTCSFFIITDYDVRFIVTDGSVGLHLLISQYGDLISITCFHDFGTWSFQCSVSDCTHISLHILSCRFTYRSSANIGHADM